MGLLADNESLNSALTEFYGTVATRLKFFQQAQRDVDLYLATRFSVFDYVDPDENQLSDIIGDLLNPEGKHGQADLFLNLFLSAIDPKLVYLKTPVKVLREDPTCYCNSFQRRIDLTLDFGSFGIGIENKPWANEGIDQLKDYREHLDRKYRGDFHLVYLSGDGSDPVSLTKGDLESLRSAGRFHKLSYPTEVVRWLESCRRDCKAQKVQTFLEDLTKYVEDHFETTEEEAGADEAN